MKGQSSEAGAARPVDLLFIHHSVGGHWLAEPGPASGASSIYATHPHGGGLRQALEAAGYTVHEASYDSRLGADTDVFDWLPKFRDQMDAVLRCDHQDRRLEEGRQNHVVMFKSCFPNNNFAGGGERAGNPAGPELTLANARAAYGALLEHFARRPDVLFVCVTTPPLASRRLSEPLWKRLARVVMRRPAPRPPRPEAGRWARELANWLKSEDGWLRDYPGRNVAVFDYYDVLTGEGRSDFAAYGSRDGTDSHPTAEGQREATRRFLPFLEQATRRAGLSPAHEGRAAPAPAVA